MGVTLSLIGSDLPTLQPRVLAEAVDRLAQRDLVIGPSTDGGYWLIGMNRPHPELFAGLPWSTSGVLAETIRRARSAGLSTALLPPDTDVDTWPDLLDLNRTMQSRPASWTTVPARTSAMIKLVMETALPRYRV